MTYEHGKAREGAPVTWRWRDGSLAVVEFHADGGRRGFALTIHSQATDAHIADLICRAFDLASLAEEAKDILGPLATHGATDPKEVANARDWLARFDAAKGE